MFLVHWNQGRRLTALALFLLSLCVQSSAWSQESTPAVVLLFPQRQAERAQSRWTLGEWLRTKKVMASQDAWLAAHTNKIPLDAALGVGVGPGPRLDVGLEINLAWLGLQARYNSPQSFLESSLGNRSALSIENTQVLLQARLLGNNPQNTALILRGLYESDNVISSDRWRGPYIGYGAGGELQVYWAQWLGVRGEYLHRFNRENIGARSLKLGGPSWLAGAFLELGALRFEGGYRHRALKFSGQGTRELTEQGLYFNTRLFL